MKFIRKNIGYIIVAITSVYPCIIWAGVLPLKYRFVGMSALTSIGQLTALVGMIVFAWSLILSTRIKLFEDYFKGMRI
jgi:predicted ferric reductase